MQRIWLSNTSWDDYLPQNIRDQWMLLYDQLKLLNDLRVPRWIGTNKTSIVQLHGFSDASEEAYAAVVYLRVVTEQGVKCHLMMSKTKVAPTQQVSIPRLELCAAQLLAKVFRKVISALRNRFDNIQFYAWTDSTIVLAWLSDYPRKWSTYVGNRTLFILDVLPYKIWRHVSSKNNPADQASRGLFPENLLHCEQWWFGPDFLYDNFEELESTGITYSTNEELRRIYRTTNVISQKLKQPVDILLERYSSFTRLLRITAWWLQIIKGCMNRAKNIKFYFDECLTRDDLNDALIIHVKNAQSIRYPEEIESLQKGKVLPKGSKLYLHEPYLDQLGVLRVGGRLHKLPISFEQRHPIILHKEDRLSELIVHEYHLKYLHAGGSLLESYIQLKFLITGVKQLIRKVIRGCTLCTRFKASSCSQKMGNFPTLRHEIGKPFQNTGVDYAGPIMVRTWKGRGAKRVKCYIAVFVCMTTTAIHLELVGDLSADGFIAAFRRFLSRRGEVKQMFSDNGTNFHGSVRHLREIYDYFKDKEKRHAVQNYLVQNEIKWNFIPPHAPHFGGLWEASVKRVKYHLKRVTANASLTYEEINTLLIQIENILNSRPLTPVTTYPEDLNVLTPNHFLKFTPSYLPEVPIKDTKCFKSRWIYVQKLYQNFWEQWQRQYLSSRLHRPKWFKQQRNLEVGDMVLVIEPSTTPGYWLDGRIREVIKGTDNNVRVALVRTKNGIIKRSITKLILLIENDCSKNNCN